jgi:hypothetical protein
MLSIFVHVICIFIIIYLFIVIHINIEELRSIKVKLFSPEIFERDY